MMDWLVVGTKARQESRAMNHLQEQGFKVYCPQIPKYDVLKEVAGKQVLFPGYCFVENGERSVSSIRSTPGVIALVSFGSEGKPASVNAEVLDEIRRVETFYGEKSPGLQSGDVVSLTGGPFKGLLGLYSKRSKDRVEVLLIVLGRQQRVLVSSSHVIG
jgi:transcriptional antiterminator RfaH